MNQRNNEVNVMAFMSISCKRHWSIEHKLNMLSGQIETLISFQRNINKQVHRSLLSQACLYKSIAFCSMASTVLLTGVTVDATK